MNLLQRIMRAPTNWWVETIYPNGAFYGKQYLTAFDNHDLSDKWGSNEAVAAMFLTSSLREMGAEDATFTSHEVTDKGEPIGNWELQIRKIGNSEN